MNEFMACLIKVTAHPHIWVWLSFETASEIMKVANLIEGYGIDKNDLTITVMDDGTGVPEPTEGCHRMHIVDADGVIYLQAQGTMPERLKELLEECVYEVFGYVGDMHWNDNGTTLVMD